MAATITIANILKAGLQSAYNALQTKDENVLYFCTDTGKMYKGSVDFTESVKVAATKPSTPVDGKVYIIQDAGTVEAYVGGAWHTITPKVNETLDANAKAGELASAKAVYDFVTEIASTITSSDKVVENITSTKAGKIDYATADGKSHEVTLAGVALAPEYDATTRKFTFHVNGAEDLVVELGKDVFVDPAGDNSYHADTKEIWLTLNNGSTGVDATVIKIPAAGLVNIMSGETSQNIKVEVDSATGKIKATAILKANTTDFTNALKSDEGGLYVDLGAYATTASVQELIAEEDKKVQKAQETADANTKAIATINGDAQTAGSIAKAVADESAALKNGVIKTAQEAADKAQKTADQAVTDAKTANDAIDVLNGTGEGSVAKAVSDESTALKNGVIKDAADAAKAAQTTADTGVKNAKAAQDTADQNAENIAAIVAAYNWGTF